MIWVFLAAMIAVALAFLLTPMLRARAAPDTEREDYDRTVYRDQLKELEVDVARGTVSAAEAAEARLEIERRVLRAAPAAVAKPARRSALAAPIVAVVVPLIAVALYLEIGAPQLPGRASPSAAVAGLPPAENIEFAEIAKRLTAKVAENPDNPEDWRLLGRTYMEMGRYAEGASAFRQGIRLLPNDPDLPTMLGEALVLNGENTVTPAAVAAFESTLKMEPKHPIARYYLALGRLQAGAAREAFDQWLELAKDSTPDAPWMRVLPERLEELAKQLKIDLAAVWPRQQMASAPPIAGAKGPTPEQMQAAGEMAPEDRQQFIRGMVERLAERLKDNPNDLDGWQRLARAYRVLGDNDNATKAEARIAALSSGAPPPTAPAAPPIAGNKGPTPEQMQAAGSMSPEDRQQFIRSMVERLADRLKDNPNDLDGWQRLARAYRVLGDNDNATKAEARVAELSRAAPPAAAPAAAPAPGPTSEQMQAGAALPTEDRAQMIRGMVERLAERLKDNPDDFDGWTRLGRSYFVMGDRQKAVEAYAKAATLRPEDPVAIANHAQAIAEAGDPRGPLPAESIRLFREVLKRDTLNPQALWAVGLADAQSGDRRGALEKWRRLLGKLPPGTPEFGQLQRRIAELEKAP